MDKRITVRLYRVRREEDVGIPFGQALQRIGAQPLLERENEVEPELIIRLERLNVNGNLLVGEMIRRQIDNLPPQAQAGQPVTALGVGSIGHSAAFAYDSALSVMALQIARNGLTPGRIGMYVENLGGNTGYELWPILREDMWDQIQRGRVRGISIGVASPETLQAADARSRNMRQAFRAMKQNVSGVASVDIELKVGRGDPDLDRAEALETVAWLSHEREEGRGGVRNLQANVIQEGGRNTELLDLLDATMGLKETLNLPNDDPNASYRVRGEFARQALRHFQAELERRYQ